MFERMVAGDIKACWIICTNPVATVANRRTVIEGLEAAELVITQDVFLDTETNGYADILLPGALWAESDSVMINSERNLTLLQQAVDPVGQALPDWQIIARVACEMGYADAFTYDSSEDVFEEIKRTWNPKTGYDLRGISYDRLRETPVQWPSPPGNRTDRNPLRYVNDGVSQKLLSAPDGSLPPARVRHRERQGRLLPAPAHAARRDARRRLPVRPQHRSPAAPVAHDDEDGQGGEAQQAELRPVRRDQSG